MRCRRALLLAACLIAASSLVAAQAAEHVLSGDDSVAGDQLGYSVALSGNRAIAGAFGATTNGAFSGAAYVFELNGADWTQQQKLVPAGVATWDFAGWSVAIDGDRAVVGAWGTNSEVGAAYVFHFEGGGWVEKDTLLAPDGATFHDFGYSVGISGDRVAVGAFGAEGQEPGSGAAYVFAYDAVGDDWDFQQKLTAGDGQAGDNFGIALAIDGNRVIVGADGEDDNGSSAGAAYVFALTGATSTQEGKLLALDGADVDFLGGAVALDGDRALVGASLDDDGGSATGSAYVFAYSGAAWGQEQKLTASDRAANDHFGSSVSLSGTLALIGAFAVDGSGADSGAAYTFSHDGSSWSEDRKVTASAEAGGDALGVSASVDGTRELLGAPGVSSGTGVAYLYAPPATLEHEFVFLANTRIELDRQYWVLGTMRSNDEIDLIQGNPSRVSGNLLSVGETYVGPSQQITGDVSAGATATIAPGATVSGTVTSGASVAPIPFPTFSFTAGGSDVNVPNNGTATLAPGTYGAVSVGNRGRLNLSTGTYFLDSLTTRNGGRIAISVNAGPVEINVVGDVLLGTRTQVTASPNNSASIDQILYNIRFGDYTVRDRAIVRGTVIAPEGTFQLGRRAISWGTVCADVIEMLPQSTGLSTTLTPVPASSPATAPARRAPQVRQSAPTRERPAQSSDTRDTQVSRQR